MRIVFGDYFLLLSENIFFMNYEDLRDYCLSLKGTTEHFPFDEFSLVMKSTGKNVCAAATRQS